MSRFKGPWFPSFAQQGTPEPRKQWISHCGRQQRTRYLRQACRVVLKSKDPETIEAIQKAHGIISGKFEEYGLLMMIHQAMETSDSTGLPIAECLNYITDKIKSDIEEQIAKATQQAKEQTDGSDAVQPE
jgi:hypothetical protein